MRFDVRWPLGALFTLLGALLVLYGLGAAHGAARALGINVDLWWGLVLAAFGIVTLLSAARFRRSSSGS
jgi:hypothetical protein